MITRKLGAMFVLAFLGLGGCVDKAPAQGGDGSVKAEGLQFLVQRDAGRRPKPFAEVEIVNNANRPLTELVVTVEIIDYFEQGLPEKDLSVTIRFHGYVKAHGRALWRKNVPWPLGAGCVEFGAIISPCQGPTKVVRFR